MGVRCNEITMNKTANVDATGPQKLYQQAMKPTGTRQGTW